MGIVGSVIKQPSEIDVYAIDYTEDMTSTDAVTAAYSFVMAKGRIGDVTAITSNTTVSIAQARYIVSAGATLTLTGMSIGDRVYISNKDAVLAAIVGSADMVDGNASMVLPAMSAVLLAKTSSGWVVEASLSVIVDAADSRVRNQMEGGYAGTTYIIETTMTTAEGRRLQDEITVKVKDY